MPRLDSVHDVAGGKLVIVLIIVDCCSIDFFLLHLHHHFTNYVRNIPISFIDRHDFVSFKVAQKFTFKFYRIYNTFLCF